MDSLTNDRWQQIDALFEQALDLDAAQRAALLEGIDDLTVRGAVERLLSADVPSFLSAQAVDYAPPLLDRLGERGEAAVPGQQIGPYRIVCEIGRGGMGTVYKAQHDRLRRPAALKFLSPHLGADGTSRRRFLAEAQAAAALDHPNICAIHDVGEADDGRLYIAMTCYEGETLRAKINRGPVSIKDALGFAARMAEGLAAAHAAGIVHRDIKPANVMVTDAGEVKLLDFGLARLDGDSIPSHPAGSRMGTLAYMSPEQVRGGDIDAGSDVWSLGVVLFEMLATRRPFAGARPHTLADHVLHQPHPDLVALRPEVPPSLARIVDQALAKDPEARHADAGAVLDGLRSVQRELGILADPHSPPTAKRVWGVLVVAVIAAVGFAAVAVSIRAGGDADASSATHHLLTDSGIALRPELSPDGRFLAYVDQETESILRLMVKDLQGGDPVVVSGPGYDYWNLRWLPDGSGLSFAALIDPRGLSGNFLVSADGGGLRRLDSGRFRTFIDWSPDGTVYAGARPTHKHITILDGATGDLVDNVDLNVPFAWLYGVGWSPRGDRLLFYTHDEDERFAIWTVGVDGSRVQKVVEASAPILSPRWSRDGTAIYYLIREGDGQGLMKVAVDPEGRAEAGPPVTVLTGLPTDDTFSLSRDGTQLVYARASIAKELWRVTLSPGATQTSVASPLTAGKTWDACPSVSPDGRAVAFDRNTGNRSTNLFVVSIEGGAPTQVTHRASANRCPVWSPDGDALAFISDEGAEIRLWTVSLGDEPRLTAHTRTSGRAVSETGGTLEWAPGARVIHQPPGSEDLVALDPETGDEAPLLAETSRVIRQAWSPRYSPDGTHVALWAAISPEPDARLWSLRVADGLGTMLHDGAGAAMWPIGWSADGQWIHLLERVGGEARLASIGATTGETRVLATLPDDIQAGISHAPGVAMSPDGRDFIFPVRHISRSDIMMIEDFDEGASY